MLPIICHGFIFVNRIVKKVFYELLSNSNLEKANEENKKEENSTQQSVETPIENKEGATEEVDTKKEEQPKEKSQPAKKNNPTQKSSKPKTAREYSGKWKIKKFEDKFYAELTASNGGLLLKTELYATLSSLKNGIETIKKNVEFGNIVITFDRNGHYRFKVFNSTNRLICISESYSSKAKCENGILSVKRFAPTASIIVENDIDF